MKVWAHELYSGNIMVSSGWVVQDVRSYVDRMAVERNEEVVCTVEFQDGSELTITGSPERSPYCIDIYGVTTDGVTTGKVHTISVPASETAADTALRVDNMRLVLMEQLSTCGISDLYAVWRLRK